jgi:hypothetical protein
VGGAGPPVATIGHVDPGPDADEADEGEGEWKSAASPPAIVEVAELHEFREPLLRFASFMRGRLPSLLAARMASCGIFCRDGVGERSIWHKAEPEPVDGHLLELDDSEVGENMDDVADSDSVGDSGKNIGSFSQRAWQDGG